MSAKSSVQRKSIWHADLGSALALVLFVIVVYGLDLWLEPQLGPLSLLAVGFVLAVIPAFIWLAFFYRRDRLEPEPKKMVLQVFVLGALLASAVGVPFLRDIFKVESWLNAGGPWSALIGGVLVVGFTQEFLKYAAVRYSVYDSAEFDEAADGIIYATAAGLGYATVLNIVLVVSSGGVELGLGAIRIVLNTLAHASVAGVTGYFLGQVKFSDRPVWWLPLGVASAAFLNGLFFYLRGLAVSTGGVVGGFGSQWVGLIMAALLAVVVTWFLARAIEGFMQSRKVKEG